MIHIFLIIIGSTEIEDSRNKLTNLYDTFTNLNTNRSTLYYKIVREENTLLTDLLYLKDNLTHDHLYILNIFLRSNNKKLNLMYNTLKHTDEESVDRDVQKYKEVVDELHKYFNLSLNDFCHLKGLLNIQMEYLGLLEKEVDSFYKRDVYHCEYMVRGFNDKLDRLNK